MAGLGSHWIEVAGGGRFACPVGERVLIAMERAGADDIAIGCRGGGCGICKVRVMSGAYRTGKMSKMKVSEEEGAAGYALACRLYPLEDISIELCG